MTDPQPTDLTAANTAPESVAARLEDEAEPSLVLTASDHGWE